MTYTPPEGVTIGSFTVDTLPASFSAPVNSVVSYKIYGTEAGVGKETENLFDYTAQDTDNGFKANNYLNGEGGVNESSNHNISEYIEIEPNTVYSLCQSRAQLAVSMCFYNSEKSFISSVVEGNAITTVTSPANAKYVRFTILISYQSEIMFVPGSTAPASYIPFGYKIPISLESGEQTQNLIVYIGDSQLSATEYVDSESGKIYKLQEGELTPTNPPLPLPSIITCDGENTISSTETLGDVEFTGEWAAIMGSTEEESIDIGFTVDADSFIAFVTVDDSTKQVFDTITMPSSAGSFTLHVVSWGSEPYTDTVYNALS